MFWGAASAITATIILFNGQDFVDAPKLVHKEKMDWVCVWECELLGPAGSYTSSSLPTSSSGLDSKVIYCLCTALLNTLYLSFVYNIYYCLLLRCTHSFKWFTLNFLHYSDCIFGLVLQVFEPFCFYVVSGLSFQWSVVFTKSTISVQ